MDRNLKLANELTEKIRIKEVFEENLDAIKSLYFNKGKIRIDIVDTDDFNSRGNNEEVYFDERLMVEYLRIEIGQLETKIQDILTKLQEEYDGD